MGTSSFSCLARSIAVALSAFTLCSPVHIDAQHAAFRSGIDLVPLTVTVTDPAGKYVAGLTGGDFAVYEDGVPQPLSFFASDHVPLDVAFVLDTSSSIRPELPLVQRAARGLVRRLGDTDRAAVVDVKNSARIPQPLTTQLDRVELAIRSLSSSGTTALYDGLYVVLKEFDAERRRNHSVRRQVLVLLSDGFDTTSRLAFDDVMELTRRTGVIVYVILLKCDDVIWPRARLDGSAQQAEHAMRRLANEAGGRMFQPASARDLPGIYDAIAHELSNQYELGYIPVKSGRDGAFRRVTVRVPPQANASARTRSGYYASRAARP
jgi:Ca-activated chloride channel homolog